MFLAGDFHSSDLAPRAWPHPGAEGGGPTIGSTRLSEGDSAAPRWLSREERPGARAGLPDPRHGARWRSPTRCLGDAGNATRGSRAPSRLWQARGCDDHSASGHHGPRAQAEPQEQASSRSFELCLGVQGRVQLVQPHMSRTLRMSVTLRSFHCWGLRIGTPRRGGSGLGHVEAPGTLADPQSVRNNRKPN